MLISISISAAHIGQGSDGRHDDDVYKNVMIALKTRQMMRQRQKMQTQPQPPHVKVAGYVRKPPPTTMTTTELEYCGESNG